ncbi:MAG: hypothetical protein QOJ81_1315 [Chloroflexota bacterium]|nr:hypothetical protein [Chloroflexota bacterium]
MRPILAVLLALSATVVPATSVAAASLPSGHFTWTGSAAASFAVPSDLRLTSSWHSSKLNLDYVRYQQFAAPFGTYVDGAQVTVVRRDNEQLIVGGAYYPGLRSVRAPLLSVTEALKIAADARGGLIDLPDLIRGLATQRANLRLDPETDRPFFLVATAAPANNRYQQIDALSGELLATWGGVDQITAGQGVGVKGDTKNLDSHPFNTIVDLTKNAGGWKLQSTDDKFITYDALGGNSVTGNQVISDADNKWGTDTPREAAGVDAQYYAALTVQFYQQKLGYDWINDCAVDLAPPAPQPHGTYGWPYKVRSVVHFDYSPGGNPYDNAFWDQEKFYMVYGDGGATDRPLSAGQDVVSHELSHAVTQCTNNLIYEWESGALNESFSDIMATAAEFTLEEPLSSNCRLAPGQTRCADWLLGEDLATSASGAVIRSLADPEAEGQPSHYAERYHPNPPTQPGDCTGSNDECGVHTNSGIPNHAFYLLVNGGRNARCSGPTDPQADCDVVVPPTSLENAMQIWFSGFVTLSDDATMCDARNATVAAAETAPFGSVTDIVATRLAWQAVGLGDQCDLSTDFKISLSDPTIELAPDASGQTVLSLDRGSYDDPVSYTVDKVGPATVTRNPTSNGVSNSAGTTVTVDADVGATDGIYPVLVTATSTGDTHYAAASFVIDAEAPLVSVSSARFLAMSSVTIGGAIPLGVTWSATDAQSGIASAQLEHSPNGSGWVAVPGTSPTQYVATAGPHQFHVVASDAVGNDATSSALVRTLTGFQETALTYTGAWSTNTTATAWGTTKYSKQVRATATLTFTGTDVVWIAQRGPKRGVANVFIDGVKTHVDLYSTSLSERRVAFIASGLSAGQHTIKIKVKATSGRPRVDVDGVFVLNP